MFFTYIVLSIGMYSLQRQKPQVVEVSPVEQVQEVKNKPKKSEPIITNVEEVQDDNENDENNIELQDVQNLWEETEDFDPELYEEISFEDNFDKEYRDDVGDSYFEYPGDEEINIPEENLEE